MPKVTPARLKAYISERLEGLQRAVGVIETVGLGYQPDSDLDRAKATVIDHMTSLGNELEKLMIHFAGDDEQKELKKEKEESKKDPIKEPELTDDDMVLED